jgi:hypothetical protein
MKTLTGARQLGGLKAIDGAEAILDRADSPMTADPLENRVNELAEALFQSIGMQLSVVKYQAIDVGRGANLDELNVPLNNRAWLKERFAALRKLDNDAAIFRGIEEILRWTDAGPGGFYDDLGNPSRQPHLVREGSYHDDPGYLKTPTIGFRSVPNWRRSWCTHIDGLYQTPVTMRYEDLDPHGRYKLRVVYAGDNFDVKIRLVAATASSDDAKNVVEIHPFQAKPQPVAPVEFEIPGKATSSGTLTLTWQSNPDRGGPGRGCQIAEVWLIKATDN